jgi:DNA-binding response OmpR family regulator
MDRDQPVVLIVDRDVDTRDRLEGWLEDVGFGVVVCAGPSAPEFTCVGSREGRCPLAQDADLVVLDLWLESDAAMMGTRAASLLRRYGSWGKPVIVMTGRHDDVMDRVDDLSQPTVDRLPDRRDLVETIRVMARARGTCPTRRSAQAPRFPASSRPSLPGTG